MPTSRRSFLETVAGSLLAIPTVNHKPNPSLSHTSRLSERASSPICVFSKHLQWLEYAPMAETAAAIGFDGVALTVRPRGHVDPQKVEDQLPRAIEAVKKAGLQAPMITTAITDPADPLTEHILKTASALGVTHYRMGYLNYDSDRSPAERLVELRPLMKDFAALNKALGVHGAYQNHSGTRIGGPVWDVYYLIEGIDPEWLGCQYDIRHATVEGGTSWPVGFKLLKDYVQITAVKDFLWERRSDRWRVKNVPLGQGMVDFPAYYELVKLYGIAGPISMHFEYPLPEHQWPEKEKAVIRKGTIEAMRRDVEALRRWLKEAGL